MDFIAFELPIHLKKPINVIKAFLPFILSKCLEVGCFLDFLKASKVIPVYKKGNRSLRESCSKL